MPSQAEPAPGAAAGARFSELVERAPLAGLRVLDVGCGRGRVALAVGPRCRSVVGIDRDLEAIREGRRRAAEVGLSTADFVVADAEDADYRRWAPGLVTARLCVSGAIVERAGRALGRGGSLVLMAFHVDHWRETGRVSRFACDRGALGQTLAGARFEVEALEVSEDVRRFASEEAALAAVAELRGRWTADGRWEAYARFVARGGRTLTWSYVVARGRRR